MDESADPLLRPVFIVGMERSGTSLLRSILNSSSELAIAPETHFVSQWAQRWAHEDLGEPRIFDSMWASFSASANFQKTGLDASELEQSLRGAGAVDLRAVHAGLLRSFAMAAGKRRSGEKVPAYFRHLTQLLEWYPDARVIYAVRSPRAVVASHRVVGAAWAQKGSAFALSRQWRQRAAAAVRWASHPQVLVIRYEDLTADPPGTIAAICSFVGIEVEPSLLSRPAPEVTASDEALPPSAAVVPTQTEVWRDRLSPSDANIVGYATRREAALLGYDSHRRLGLVDRLRCWRQAVTLVLAAPGRRASASIRTRRSRPRSGQAPSAPS